MRLIAAFGVSLVAVEFVLGGLLLLGWQTTLVGILSSLLVLMFVVASAKVLIKKQKIECGCFGLLYRETISKATLVRDSILLMACISVAYWGTELPTLGSMLTGDSWILRIGSLFAIVMTSQVLFVAVKRTLGLIARERANQRSRQQMAEWIRQRP